ncbi:hypothetical protein RIF29_18817 [Crotalaria pallida]|uniref:LOB domain-containing protein n=1 Tax=Crotalaria pallida TaxID=3830 RepID=A0AAN9F2U5_CROPI
MHSKMKKKNKNKNKNKNNKRRAVACAACNCFGKDCPQDCPFAPYFPAHDPQRFAVVHKIFGANNFEDVMKDVPKIKRAEAVEDMVNDAKMRERDGIDGLRDPSVIDNVLPLYECHLKQQVDTMVALVDAGKTALQRLRNGAIRGKPTRR